MTSFKIAKPHPCPNYQALLYPNQLKPAAIERKKWYQYEPSLIYRCPKCWMNVRKAGWVNRYADGTTLPLVFVWLMWMANTFHRLPLFIVLMVLIISIVYYVLAQRHTYYELVDDIKLNE